MEEQNRQIDRIELMTQSNMKDQTFYLRYQSRMSIRLRTDVMQKHNKLMHKVRSRYPDYSKEEVSYAAMILAIKVVYAEKEQIVKLNFSDLSLDEIRNVTVKKIELHIDKVFVRDRPKQEELFSVLGEIKLLRSYRETQSKVGSYEAISQYLKKEHDISADASTIWRFLRNMEGEE